LEADMTTQTSCAVIIRLGTLFVLLAAIAGASIPVDPPQLIAELEEATTVALVDWDMDGDLDVVAGSQQHREIGLWDNQGSGWQRAPGWQLPHGEPHDLAIGDIDGNGQPDLLYAMGGNGDDAVGLVLNRDSDLPVTIDTEREYCATLGDLDGDGDLDAIACRFRTLVWYENVDGDGETWSTRFFFEEGYEFPQEALVHDVDVDGDLDVVVAIRGQVVWFENRLNAAPTTWLGHVLDPDTNVDVSSLAIGDLDGDGETEITGGASSGATGLLVWWDRPSSLSDPWTRRVLKDSDRFDDVEVADADQDGDVDIIASCSSCNPYLRLWRNEGAATFTDLGIASGSYSPAGDTDIGDIDDDGDPDFVLAGAFSDVLDSIENRTIRSSVVVGAATSTPSRGGPAPLALGAVDLDRDGDLDIVRYDEDRRLRWSDSVADSGELLQAAGTLLGPGAFALADVDADGDTDVVVGVDAGLEWLENIGLGSLLARNTIDSSAAVEDLAVVDLDGDGQLDVVGYDAGLGDARWWRNLGAGASWFGNPVDTSISGWRDMTISDLDGDGAVEIVIAADGAVTAYSRVVDIAFSQSTVSDFGSPLVVAADFDDDGDVDVGGYRPSTGELLFWSNDGRGGGWAETPTPFAPDMQQLAAVDLDLDGDIDLVGASPAASAYALNPGSAIDPFPTGARPLGGMTASTLAVADLTGDGYPDAVGGDAGMTLAETLDGQYSFEAVAAPPMDIEEGSAAVVADIALEHLGRPGDLRAVLDQVRVSFRELDGSPLQGDQLDALLQRVRLTRIDGGSSVLAEVVDPDGFGPVVLTVDGGDNELPAPPDVQTPSVAQLVLTVTLESDAADVASAVEVVLSNSLLSVLARDEAGTDLRRRPAPEWVRQLNVVAVELLGDADCDGVLEADDLAALVADITGSESACPGADADDDGDVDRDDIEATLTMIYG
jgi:hypothetical protein